jgi:hypothetical protein
MPDLQVWIQKGLIFVGILALTTFALWSVWWIVAPALGIPRLDYVHFVLLYLLVRGMLRGNF